MESRLGSSWQVRYLAGEPVAVVRVQNLRAVAQVGDDAWGRKGKSQPLLVTAELSFDEPFGASATSDTLRNDTVHYGNLSKAILASLESLGRASDASESKDTTLRTMVDHIWKTLLGAPVLSLPNTTNATAFLSEAKLRYLSISATLPKASLLGDGVTLTASATVEPQSTGLSVFAVSLRLPKLRIPTLIGVNSNERLRKQFIIADVEIDRLDYVPDIYAKLESFVVHEMEASSFETLEALGSHLMLKVATEFRPDQGPSLLSPDCQIRITMEKPSAVPFADCPVVEVQARMGDVQAGARR